MSGKKRFLTVLKTFPQDFEPYGSVEREGGDCSSGCKHYTPLHDAKDALGMDTDFGVCTNSESHRSGLLTFEHQGCGKFERDSLT